MLCHYTCDQCELHRNLVYLPRVYSLDHGRVVPMQQRHIWCSGCNDISVCESLVRMESDVEHIQESLRELRAFRDSPPADLSKLNRYQRARIERAPETIDEIERRESEWHEWRSRRQAPVRCLKCGGPVEHVPSSDCESLSHGGCGGTIHCSVTVASFNGPAEGAHVYTIDGVLLELGKKPRAVPGQLAYEYVPMELFCSG